MGKKSKNPKKELQKIASTVAIDAIKNYHQNGAASPTNNAFRAIRATRNSPLEDIEDNQERITALSRNADMINPLARGPIDKIGTNVVGSGLLLNPKPDGAYLGLSDDEASAWESHVRREWNIWAKSKDCDAYGRLTFELNILEFRCLKVILICTSNENTN